MNVTLNVKLLEKVDYFKDLGRHLAVDVGIEREVKFRIHEVGKVCGGMKMF